MHFNCGFSYLKLLQFTVNINVEILIHPLKMSCQHTEPGGRAELVHMSVCTPTSSLMWLNTHIFHTKFPEHAELGHPMTVTIQVLPPGGRRLTFQTAENMTFTKTSNLFDLEGKF